MHISLFVSGVIGCIAGWYIPDFIGWVKSKCSVKSSPDKNEREKGRNPERNFNKTKD